MTRRHLLIALAALAALVVAYLAGRHAAAVPDSTTQERATERVEAQVVEVFSGAEEWVTRREAVTDTHQVRDENHGRVVTTWHPDGRVVEEKEPSHVREETSTKATETESGEGKATVQATKAETVYIDRWRTRTEKVTTPAPDWLVGPSVGLSSQTGALYGGQANRRILGPAHLGIMVLGNGDEVVGVLTAAGAW